MAKDKSSAGRSATKGPGSMTLDKLKASNPSFTASTRRGSGILGGAPVATPEFLAGGRTRSSGPGGGAKPAPGKSSGGAGRPSAVPRSPATAGTRGTARNGPKPIPGRPVSGYQPNPKLNGPRPSARAMQVASQNARFKRSGQTTAVPPSGVSGAIKPKGKPANRPGRPRSIVKGGVHTTKAQPGTRRRPGTY